MYIYVYICILHHCIKTLDNKRGLGVLFDDDGLLSFVHRHMILDNVTDLSFCCCQVLIYLSIVESQVCVLLVFL